MSASLSELWRGVPGEAPFLIDAADGAALTGAEMDRLSRQAIGLLRSRGAPSRLVLRASGGAEQAALLAGALRAGIATAILHPKAPDSQLRATEAAWPGSAIWPIESGESLAELLAEAEPGEPAEPDPEADAVVIFSSGSTGPARGVRLSWRSLATGINRVTAALPAWGALLRPGLREGVPALLHTITGYRLGLVAPLVRGTVPVLLPREASAAELLGLAGAHRVEILHAGPGFVRAVNAARGRLTVPGALRAVTAGGGPLSPEEREDFVRLTGLTLIHTYGLTEAAGTCTACAIQPGQARVFGMGPPLLPARIRGGCVELRPEAPASGTLGEQSIAPDGWIRTGDLGHLDAAGNLHILGRAARTFTTPSGEKVQLEDLEGHLRGVFGVPCVAVPVLEPGREPRIGALLEGQAPGEAQQLAARAALRARLPPHAMPAIWRFVPALPRLPGGKPDLLAAAARLAAERTEVTPYAPVFDQRGHRYHRAMLAQPGARERELARVAELAELQPGLRVLDLPSGGGYLRPHLRGAALQEVESARGFPLSPGALRCEDLCALPLPEASFDRVISLAAAHHIADELAFYQEIFRLVRPGGRMVLGDAEAGGPVARFLNGFVHEHTSLGHQGRFLDAESPARLAAAGFTEVRVHREPVDWLFPDQPAMLGFCRDLFGVEADDEALARALREGPGVEQGRVLRWTLIYLTARRPEAGAYAPGGGYTPGSGSPP